VRRKGRSITKTFETRAEAEEWARIVEGKVTGEEYQDQRQARDTTVGDACQWYVSSLSDTPDARNKRTHLKYWIKSEFASWSLVALTPADLVEWRQKVLDEHGGGEDAECKPQTAIHRLNFLSQVYKKWSLSHSQAVSNPVVEGVRPGQSDGRTRRLKAGEERRLLNACRYSNRRWLRPAVVISLETCIRQGELLSLRWEDVSLVPEYPYIDLPKTKNGRARRVPLSRRAVAAFKLLSPKQEGGVLPIQSEPSVFRAFRKIITEENFPDLRWHDFRHEAISRLFERSDLRDHEIMAISGHLRPEMLARYTHLRADRLADRLPGGRNNRRA